MTMPATRKRITLSLITPMKEDADMGWFRECAQSAMSVARLVGAVEWRIAAPTKTAKRAKQVVLDLGADKIMDVRIYARQTRNVAFTRNELLKESIGKYFMQLDCDDVLVASGVDILIKEIEEAGVMWGAAPFYDFNERSCPVFPQTLVGEERYPEGVIPKWAIREQRQNPNLGRNFIHPGASIFRTDLFVGIGGYDEYFCFSAEDYMFLSVISSRDEGVWSPVPSLLYRISDGSLMTISRTEEEWGWYSDYVEKMEATMNEMIEEGCPIERYTLPLIRKRAGLE